MDSELELQAIKGYLLASFLGCSHLQYLTACSIEIRVSIKVIK